ncbi:hypothetical protein [uncultured Dokdonia sp.]|uniref:hypothetical protein n=1 Tax=uncultured Dokdonia sp. TaxID=575653 RepID=UPI002606EEC2|nr:hypothetical protein [uncultured Dokdonia sp.]
MPKKGSRKIIVDHEPYFWKVIADEDLYFKQLIIENTKYQDYQIEALFDYRESLTISPNMVSQIIHLAMHNGWSPGKSQEKKYIFKDFSKLKIKTTAIWKPAVFNGKQVLKKGVTDLFYFTNFKGLSFSWGEFDIGNDFKASCKIDEMIHDVYGEIYSVESVGEQFIISGAQINEKIDMTHVNDVEKWTLKVTLSEFIKLPKRNYENT